MHNMICTDIFDDAAPDLRACKIGGTESSSISRALSPDPTVKANNPIEMHYNVNNLVKQVGKIFKGIKRIIKRLTNNMTRQRYLFGRTSFKGIQTLVK